MKCHVNFEYVIILYKTLNLRSVTYNPVEYFRKHFHPNCSVKCHVNFIIWTPKQQDSAERALIFLLFVMFQWLSFEWTLRPSFCPATKPHAQDAWQHNILYIKLHLGRSHLRGLLFLFIVRLAIPLVVCYILCLVMKMYCVALVDF